MLVAGPLLMILFRKKYPRWWFDWNRELLRFGARVHTYVVLMNDEYPSTDEQQWVHLEIEYPNVETDLARGMPLVKWLLAIPHYVVLFFLGIAAFFAVIIAWFAILFTGRYPRSIFDFVLGCSALGAARRRLRVHPDHGQVPAVLPGVARRRNRAQWPWCSCITAWPRPRAIR